MRRREPAFAFRGRGMDIANIVSFKSARQLLADARSCINIFSDDTVNVPFRTVSLLIRAFKYADEEFKYTIIRKLGSIKNPTEDIARHLYSAAADFHEADYVRHEAALQLSAIMPRLDNPQPMLMQLLDDVQHKHAHRRAGAALGLGWENNLQAVPPLIELLFDDDITVQQMAVKALCRIKDDNLRPLLADRLQYASPEVRETIQEHLRFFHDVPSRDEKV